MPSVPDNYVRGVTDWYQSARLRILWALGCEAHMSLLCFTKFLDNYYVDLNLRIAMSCTMVIYGYDKDQDQDHC